MTPEEVQTAVLDGYITPLHHDTFWHRRIAPHTDSYSAFAAVTYNFVDRLASEAEFNGAQKIGYVKARATTGLWEIDGGSLRDPDYLKAKQLIKDKCRLPTCFPPLEAATETTTNHAHRLIDEIKAKVEELGAMLNVK